MSTEVSESTGYGPDLEMSLFGYAIAVLIAVFLLPLLPFALVGWLLWRFLRDDDAEPARRSWKRKGRRSKA